MTVTSGMRWFILYPQPLRPCTEMGRMKQTAHQKTCSLLRPAGCSITSPTATTRCCRHDAPSSAKARDSTWTPNQPLLHPALSSLWCKNILFLSSLHTVFKYSIYKLQWSVCPKQSKHAYQKQLQALNHIHGKKSVYFLAKNAVWSLLVSEGNGLKTQSALWLTSLNVSYEMTRILRNVHMWIPEMPLLVSSLKYYFCVQEWPQWMDCGNAWQVVHLNFFLDSWKVVAYNSSPKKKKRETMCSFFFFQVPLVVLMHS